MKYFMIFTLIIALIGLGLMVTASEEKKAEYIGVSKCKMCHSKVKMGGAEYFQWEKGHHSKAFEILASEESKKAASELGIADPQADPKCLKCHVTDPSSQDAKMLSEGVSCERCHGAGSLYKSAGIMKNHEEAVANGLKPLKGKTEEETLKNTKELCLECHGMQHKDENPLAKEFNFEEAWPKVKHDETTLKAAFPDKFE